MPECCLRRIGEEQQRPLISGTIHCTAPCRGNREGTRTRHLKDRAYLVSKWIALSSGDEQFLGWADGLAPLTLGEHRRDTNANCLWSRRCRRLEHSSRRRYRSSPREGRRRRGKRLKRCRGRPLQLTHSVRPPARGRASGADVGEAARLLCLPRVALGGGVSRGEKATAARGIEPSRRRVGIDSLCGRAGGRMDGLVSWRS